MRNYKFLDNHKKAIAVYSTIIVIVFFISLIVYSPDNEFPLPTISSSFLISYTSENGSISQINSSSSLMPLIDYFPNKVSLVKKMSIPSNLTLDSKSISMSIPSNLTLDSKSISMNIPSNLTLDSESISQSTNFIGIVLALLFTLIVLPIQYILGRYSQELVNRVLWDNTFKFTLYFFVFVFVIELIELIIFGAITGTYWSYIVLTINFTFIVLALLTFIIFINRVFYLLNIGNHLIDIKDEIVGIIPLACENQDYSNEIIDKTEIIFDSIQKSLRHDRFETVISGLNNILEITLNYIEECKPGKNNKFISFIIDGLYDTKDIISINNNPKTLEKIILVSVKICERMFNLEKMPSDFISKIVDLLNDIVLDTNIVKKTSSVQIKGIEGLFNIGKQSIEKDSSILRDVTYSLSKIGRIKDLSDVRFKLRSYSNKKLSKLLFLSFDKIEIIYEFNLNGIIEEINQNIIFSLSTDAGGIISRDILPFIDPDKKYSLANFFIKISKSLDNNYSLKFMNTILENYSRYIDLCIKNLNFLKALPDIILILNSNYKTLAITLSIISKSDEKLIYILQKQMDIFYLIIEYNFKYYSKMKFKFKEYIILIPLSLYLISIYNKNNIFDKIIKKSILKIIELIQEQLERYKKEVKNNMGVNQKVDKKELNDLQENLINIYPYIRLTGALLYTNYKEYDFMLKIREVLNEYKTVGLDKEVFIYPEYYRLPGFNDLEDEELTNNLNKVNRLNNHDFDEYDKEFIGDFI